MKEKLDQIVYNTLLELYLKNEQQNVKLPEKSVPYYSEEDENQSKDESYDIWSPIEESLKDYSEKVLYLLRKPAYQQENYYTFDNKNQEGISAQYKMLLQALILLLQSTKKNAKCVLFIYEKLGLFYDVIQYYMDSKDYENVVKECIKLSYKTKNPLDLEANEGEIDSHMFTKVLEYFVSECKSYDSVTKEYERVLEYLKKNIT